MTNPRNNHGTIDSTPKGLERIVVIDAHVPGKTMVVQVSGHANLTGTNGAGKTTLLKLIPFFYGANPGGLMPRIGGKLPFTDYLLPRATSILVFEYRNHLGLNCAVVFRHASGQKPAYRFLKAGFEPEHFQELRDGQLVFVEGRHLGKHWTGRGLHHSNQLENVVDYRAVIQGNQALVNQSSDPHELDRLVGLYSLSSKRNLMHHMEAVTHAILDRNPSIESIRTLLASIMRDNGLELPDNKLNRNLREDVKNIQTLRLLDTEMPKFRGVIDAGVSHVENSMKLKGVAEELSVLLRENDEEQIENSKRADVIRESIHALKRDWEQRERELQGARAQAKAEKERAEGDLNQLLDERRVWDESDIDAKKFAFVHLQDRIDDESEAQRHVDELTEGSKDIEAAHGDRCAREESLHKDRIHQAQLAIGECQLRLSATDSKHNVRLAELEHEHSAAMRKITDEYAVHLGDLSGQRTIAEDRGLRLMLTQEESDRIAQAEAVVKSAQIEVRTKNTAIESAEHIRDEAKKQADSSLSAWQEAKKYEEQVAQDHRELQEQIKPDASSWLATLQRENPHWHDNIGRVVRREVLLQKGLSPARNVADSQAVFGWAINFAKVDKPEWAVTAEELSTRLREKEAKWVNAEAESGKAKRQLTQSNGNLTLANRSLDEARRKKTQAEKAQEAAESALGVIRDDCQNAARARQEKSKLTAAELARQIKEVTARRAEEYAQETERHEQAVQDTVSQKAYQSSEIENDIRTNTEAQAAHEKAHRERLKKFGGEFKAQLSAKGLDETVIEQATNNLKEAKSKRKEVQGYRESVDQYNHWLARHWSRQEEMTRKVAQTVSAFQVAEKQLYDENQAHNLRRNMLLAEQDECLARGRVLQGVIDTCKNVLRLIPGGLGLRTEMGISRGDATMLAAEATHLLEDQKALEKRIREGITRAENIICAGSDASRLRKAWEAQREEVKSKMADPENMAAFNLNMTVALNDMINVQLPLIREGDLLAVTNAGHQLKAFYKGLEVAKDLINRHARMISTEIGKGMRFDAIRDIKIELTNRIEDQDYWADLKAFVGNWDAWESSQGNELLPDSLGEELLSMSSVLARPKLQDSIESVFDLSISLVENGTAVTVRTSGEMRMLSSNGLAFLVLMSVYAGITRMLCADADVRIHWPVDELGVLAYENVNALFQLLDAHGIVIVSGFPSTERALLQHFKHNHGVSRNEGLIEIKVPADRFEQLARQYKGHKENRSANVMDEKVR